MLYIFFGITLTPRRFYGLIVTCLYFSTYDDRLKKQMKGE